MVDFSEKLSVLLSQMLPLNVFHLCYFGLFRSQICLNLGIAIPCIIIVNRNNSWNRNEVLSHTLKQVIMIPSFLISMPAPQWQKLIRLLSVYPHDLKVQSVSHACRG